jgi:hypothetical protein
MLRRVLSKALGGEPETDTELFSPRAITRGRKERGI